MKYSDGFFVFHMECSEITVAMPSNLTVVQEWVHTGDIEGFDSYTYYWLIQDNKGYKCEFHEAPIWIDTTRELMIIFLNDYQLISEVIHAASIKFKVNLLPLSLATRATIMNDGNLIVTNKGISNTFNKVKTTLLKTDQQRVSVIESVLVSE